MRQVHTYGIAPAAGTISSGARSIASSRFGPKALNMIARGNAPSLESTYCPTPREGFLCNRPGLDRPRSYPGKDSIQSHQPRQGLDIQPLPELAEPAWTPRVGPRTVQPGATRMSTPIGVVYTSPRGPWRGFERHGLHTPWRRSESHGPGIPGEVPNVTAPGSLAGSPKHKTQAVPGRCSGLSCCRPIRAASRARHAWARRSLLTAHRFGGLV